MTCRARQHSDTMICDRCSLQWDVNDTEPPSCSIVPAQIVTKREAARVALSSIREKLK